jgi:hypothetical protein
MYIRMVIGECNNEDQVRQFRQILTDYLPQDALGRGFRGVDFLQEEDGRMVVLQFKWNDRASCALYHQSSTYRRLVAATQHLLIGDFVVKQFTGSDLTLPGGEK